MAELGEREACGTELPFPPIDHHEVGERLAVIEAPRHVAAHDFANRGHIVLHAGGHVRRVGAAGGRLLALRRSPDPEPPVFALLRPPTLEPY